MSDYNESNEYTDLDICNFFVNLENCDINSIQESETIDGGCLEVDTSNNFQTTDRRNSIEDEKKRVYEERQDLIKRTNTNKIPQNRRGSLKVKDYEKPPFINVNDKDHKVKEKKRQNSIDSKLYRDSEKMKIIEMVAKVKHLESLLTKHNVPNQNNPINVVKLIQNETDERPKNIDRPRPKILQDLSYEENGDFIIQQNKPDTIQISSPLTLIENATKVIKKHIDKETSTESNSTISQIVQIVQHKMSEAGQNSLHPNSLTNFIEIIIEQKVELEAAKEEIRELRMEDCAKYQDNKKLNDRIQILATGKIREYQRLHQ